MERSEQLPVDQEITADLLASCEELKLALALAMRAMEDTFVADLWLADLKRHAVKDGIGVRAEAAIKRAKLVG